MVLPGFLIEKKGIGKIQHVQRRIVQRHATQPAAPEQSSSCLGYIPYGTFAANTISRWLMGRIAAFAIDYLIITVYLILLTTVALVVSRTFPSIPRAMFGNPASGQITGFMVITLQVTMYFALLESSSWQSTLGKRWKRLRVVDKNNGRLSRMRTFGRTLLKFIPGSCPMRASGRSGFPPGMPHR